MEQATANYQIRTATLYRSVKHITQDAAAYISTRSLILTGSRKLKSITSVHTAVNRS